MVHIHNGILLSHKKEWSSAICSNMDATRDDHVKWSRSERERHVPSDIPYMWNLKCGTNEPLYTTETDSQTENRRVVAKGEGGEEVRWTGNFKSVDANHYI